MSGGEADVAVFSAAMAACATAEEFEPTMRVFRMMQERGVEPNTWVGRGLASGGF
jgi:pentatricopeptide repeat protein